MKINTLDVPKHCYGCGACDIECSTKAITMKQNVEGVKQSFDGACKEVYDYGLVGFWYTKNYGAALNAFALANTIRSLGYSVLMIEAPGTQYGEDAHVYETNSPVRQFISHYFSVSNKQNSYYELQKLNDECKGFLLGSDQLWGWQPGGYHLGGAYYVLDFVNAVKKKIAYGTSFGKTDFHGDTEDNSAFGFYLRRFADVSVREQDAVGICDKRFGVNATWVVDPVFLLSEDDYMLVAKRNTMDMPLHDDPYIFVYLLQPTKEKNEIIRQIASSKGMKIIAVSDLDPKYDEAYQCDEWEFEHFTEIEVADWLGLMKGAGYVITDSYHGFCFSIIFRKQFIALSPRGGLNRFQTIAGMIGLEKKINIGRIAELDSSCLAEIDYNAVWNKLQPEIDRSRKWLTDALAKEYVPEEVDYLYDVLKFENIRIREDYDKKLQASRDQYFSMSSKLRRQSYVTRKYIVRDYLIDRLEGKSVAIRGAGGHTDQLLGILSDSVVNIICVWDKNVNADTYGGFPVVRNVTDTEMREVDAVLISSWKYRKEMKEDVIEEIEKNNIKGIEVVDFYEELQQKGIPIDSEYFWFDWDF